ncbi:MAG: DUF5017 domain-containing protein [Bacteroidales bacterium]
MKTKYILPVLMLGIFASCNDLLDDVDFEVTPAAGNVYKVGEPVTFNLTGNPDYITFFSGEEGSNYKNRFRTEIAMEDIQSAEFSFAAKRQYGVELKTMEVFISDSYAGLTKKDAQSDQKALHDANWTSVVAPETMDKASASAFTPMGPIDISDYMNHCVLAFRYQGTMNGKDAQRTWTLNQFKIRCVLKSGKIIESGAASSLNFSAFDELKVGTANDPYQFVVAGRAEKGIWFGGNIDSANEVQMQGGTKTDTDNLDWLISTPLKLNSCTPDVGYAIKDITTTLNSHTHVFEKAGTYEVVFVVGNANYQGAKEKVKKITITIEA